MAANGQDLAGDGIDLVLPEPVGGRDEDQRFIDQVEAAVLGHIDQVGLRKGGQRAVDAQLIPRLLQGRIPADSVLGNRDGRFDRIGVVEDLENRAVRFAPGNDDFGPLHGQPVQELAIAGMRSDQALPDARQLQIGQVRRDVESGTLGFQIVGGGPDLGGGGIREVKPGRAAAIFMNGALQINGIGPACHGEAYGTPNHCRAK